MNGTYPAPFPSLLPPGGGGGKGGVAVKGGGGGGGFDWGYYVRAIYEALGFLLEVKKKKKEVDV